MMTINDFFKLAIVIGAIILGAACAERAPNSNAKTATGAAPSLSPASSSQADPEFEAFKRGGSPPELTVEARPGKVGRIEFGGVMKDADMVSVAQYRIARKEGAEWKLAARWMGLILGGGQWEEPTGRYTGASMQHMTVEPGIYRIIVRAEDSTGSVAQAVSNEVEIR